MKSKFLSLILILTLTSCSSIYYSTMEKFGIEKRDIFISRIKAARDSQQDTKKQFKDALEEYRSIVEVKGGDLEKTYDKLSGVLEDCESQATEVKGKVQKVRDVAVKLFAEWKEEISEYSNETYKKDSQEKLEHSKAEYAKMMGSMKIAVDRLDPAIKPLKDSVLYLKHNLNAKAVSSLDTELVKIESKVDELIVEVNRAIDDSEKFITEFKQ